MHLQKCDQIIRTDTSKSYYTRVQREKKHIFKIDLVWGEGVVLWISRYSFYAKKSVSVRALNLSHILAFLSLLIDDAIQRSPPEQTRSSPQNLCLSPIHRDATPPSTGVREPFERFTNREFHDRAGRTKRSDPS